MVTGNHFRIDDAGRLWIGGSAAGWREYPISAVSLNEYWPNAFKVDGRKVDISDTGLDFRRISHVLGLARLDHRRAAEIWAAEDSVKGEAVAVDFAQRELSIRYLVGNKALASRSPGLVWPLSAFVGIVVDDINGGLLEKWPSDPSGKPWPIRRFPLSPAALAERAGLKLLRNAESE